jgi:HD-GYP domain-containing protein (c-di-GMP phosphodiesterase class II)
MTDLALPSPEARALERALHERDLNTGLHCDRTRGLALEMGEALALDGLQLQVLGLAAQLHDVGKIGIPDAILLKPGRFEPGEYEFMKQHPRIGHDILAELAGHPPELLGAVLHHHEAFDGSGYPDGLSGEAIPLLARILTLADCYDAMAEVRPYHPARPHEAIVRAMVEEMPSKFDSFLLDRFVRVVATSPYRSQAAPG